MRTRPLVTRFSPAAARSSVDLPHPDEPITEIISPFAAVNDTSRRTSCVPLPGCGKDWLTDSKAIGCAVVFCAAVSTAACVCVISRPSFLALAPALGLLRCRGARSLNRSGWVIPFNGRAERPRCAKNMSQDVFTLRFWCVTLRATVTNINIRHNIAPTTTPLIHSKSRIMSPGVKLWLAGRQPSPVAGCSR